ncbi:ArnT family glycosyltransferase [Paenibacillus nasutitermitis]|uniref:Glycosyltransferase RgtA/B/C/D-like domain-containing protein n=1 Tax=Paenibacillus nasutitermitis TaxID=1652958 RepID=A0A917DPR3_9BACL|nr:glycosyltransferase family 39 protein [Paenibacillus nasutitermitis]GGD57335.1 hypothetical protein GCM10010911_13920 [Paenibacillus nasutitermitis]
MSLIAKKFKIMNKTVMAIMLLIAVIAVFLRFDFLLSVSHQVSHDTINYDVMVRQLLDKGIYAYKSTESNAQVSPGYPLFMAAVYKLAGYEQHDPFPYIRYIQVFLSLVTIVLAGRIATRLGGLYAGLISAAIMAVYPPFIWANGAILTETLASMLLLLYLNLQLAAFEKTTTWSAMLAGAAMGLLVLTRSEFLIMLAASYLFYWIWKKDTLRMSKLLLFTALGTALILSPWVARNMITLHQPVIASTQVNPFAAGTYPDKNYEDGLVDRHNKTQMEVARERLKVGFTEHTWTFVKWYTVGKIKYIYGKMFFGSGHSPLYPVIPFRQAFHIGTMVAGLGAVALLLRQWRQPALLLVILLAAISITRLAFVPEYRYNFTAMPIFMILDGLLAAMLTRSIARRFNWKNRLPAEDFSRGKHKENAA